MRTAAGRRLGGSRGDPRLLRGERDDRIELGIYSLDYREVRVEPFDRAYLTTTDKRDELARGFAGKTEVGHDGVYFMAPCTNRRSSSVKAERGP